MTTDSLDNPRLRAALDYAARGWAVFPLQHPTAEGECSCGRKCELFGKVTERCAPDGIGKGPFVHNGHLIATTETEKVREWWSVWREANIGINPALSGLVVIDVDAHDPRHRLPFAQLTALIGKEALKTLTARSANGGRHFYYRAPEGVKIVGGMNRLGEAIDVCAHALAVGVYVVAPPSRLATGRYVWVDAGPDRRAVLDLPPALIERLRERPREGE
ncbi:MAG TPA: bifunctional DNA primase/polymerase [Thermomicrobiales bacterium]|jgi:hypothetical protein